MRKRGTMAEEVALEDRIAARAKVTVDDVRAVFESQGIPLGAPPARPRPLRIHRLRVAGVRTGALEPGPFNTTFRFGDGLTALVASNLRGKSSVLELVTWCLRGTPREKSGAIHWLREVDLDATVAGQAMAFRLDLDNEEITSAVAFAGPDLAALETFRAPDPAQGVLPLFRAASSESYAEQVQALMMKWMDLHPLVSAKQGTSAVAHGWPAYFGALYLPAARSPALLGDVLMSGLPGRLLQVFLDLPAAGVLTKVKTQAELMATARKRRQSAAKSAQEERTAQRQQTEEDLAAAHARLEQLAAGAAGSDQESLADLATTTMRLATSWADSQQAWDDLMRVHRRPRDSASGTRSCSTTSAKVRSPAGCSTAWTPQRARGAIRTLLRNGVRWRSKHTAAPCARAPSRVMTRTPKTSWPRPKNASKPAPRPNRRPGTHWSGRRPSSIGCQGN
jgi:hypothetical protein